MTDNAIRATQAQIFRKAQERAADCDRVFLQLVADGMTRGELQQHVNNRPSVWKRYAHWIKKLPE